MTNKIGVGRPKSSEKQLQILNAASRLFLTEGFSKTSMDNVAQLANVSKQTVYSHFANKNTLFKAVIELKVQQYCLDSPIKTGNISSVKQQLTTFAKQFLKLIQDHDVIAMYKVIISESDANPTVAEMFYETGPRKTIDTLANYFIAASNSTLENDTAQYFATSFFNMLKGEHYIQRLMGLPLVEREQDHEAFVTTVVNQFILLLSHLDCHWTKLK